MGKIKDKTIDQPVIDPVNEYRFNDEGKKHLHTYLGKPLLGTSTVVGVIAKPLTWWASGLAVAKFGWINPKTNTPENVETALQEGFERVKGLDKENYAKLLGEAYKAHSVKLTDSADAGTDLHAELERYIKNTILGSTSIYTDRILPFITWANENVKRFLWSELYCYSERLWVGGISDCGVELKDGKVGIIDFKSSKESYESQFIQCAGYDIQITENGGLTKEGYKVFTLAQPIDFYAIVPFGAKEFTLDMRYNTEELKKGFESAVVLYKITSK